MAVLEGLHERNPNHTQSYNDDSLPRLPFTMDAVDAVHAVHDSVDATDTIDAVHNAVVIINAFDTIDAVHDAVDTINVDVHIHRHRRRHVTSFSQSYKLAAQLLQANRELKKLGK